MRDERKAYWGADLPKGSDALAELDQFAIEQGLISRSDATRIILIEWAKTRRHGVQSVVLPQAGAPPPLQGQAVERPRRALNGNAAAVDLDL